MSILTNYIDEFGNEISIEKLTDLDYYVKKFAKNGVVYKKEHYSDNVFTVTTYVVSSKDEIDDLLNVNPDVSVELSYIQFGHNVTEHRNYKERIIVGNSVLVYNSQDLLICYSKLYTVNDGLSKLRTEKYYYDNSGEEKYMFEYNDDGTCFLIYDSQNYQSDIYAWSIGDPDVAFTWAGFEYYQYDEPLIPIN